MSKKILVIDKTSHIPIADQVANNISNQILSGERLPGEKLPAEREIAKCLGISRGTVKRAYEKLLQSKAIEIRQGSGSYVLENGKILEMNKKKEALEIISFMISRLQSIGLSDKEILNLVNLHISAQDSIRKLSIMVVSNNHEILMALEKQLSYFSSISLFSFTLSYFTLNTIKKNQSPIELLFNYDLIIATSIDFKLVLEIAPIYARKIIEANISPFSETLIALSKLPRDSRFNIVYQTPVFLELVKNTLLNMGFKKNHFFEFHDYEYRPKCHFDNHVNVILNFNASPVYVNSDFAESNQTFLNQGGVIIRFEYRIDRNSLIEIEDKIQRLLSE